MIIVDTPFHLTFRSHTDLPVIACTGRCKKVFWDSDIESEEHRVKCSQCGDKITEAVLGVHYTVVSKANRNLKVSDFKRYGEFSHSEKKKLQGYLSQGAIFDHLSKVKPKFESRAVKEWMPNGLNVDVSIKE